MCKNGRIWRWVDHTVGHSTLSRFDSSRAALNSETSLLVQLFIVTFFGAINFDCKILILVKHGKWSDMLLITTPAVVLKLFMS